MHGISWNPFTPIARNKIFQVCNRLRKGLILHFARLYLVLRRRKNKAKGRFKARSISTLPSLNDRVRASPNKIDGCWFRHDWTDTQHAEEKAIFRVILASNKTIQSAIISIKCQCHHLTAHYYEGYFETAGQFSIQYMTYSLVHLCTPDTTAH